MNITLLPHQEKVVEAAINAGVIHSVEEWIDSAIAYVPNAILAGSSAAKATNLVELFDPVRGLLSDNEIEFMFGRDPSPGRPVDLT